MKIDMEKVKRINPPIEYIKIEIKDNGKYADIALFFDNPQVMKEIARLRQSWLEGKTINHDEIDDFINKDREVEEARHFWHNFLEGRKIAKRFNVGATYTKPITAAVLSGIVTDDDYSTLFKENPIYNLPEELQLDEEIIFASRRVRKNDLKTLQSTSDTKSISTIKRHREWYWLYQKMGYRKLAKLKNKPLETIRSGVKSYEKMINSSYRVV